MRYSDRVFRYNGKNLKQVSRPRARKAWNGGVTVYFVPCNLRVNSPWTQPAESNKSWSHSDSFEQFDREFCYHNCNPESGKYPNYFIEVN